MSFTPDESNLNSINLKSIEEYQTFLDQLKPLLLDQSGYKEVSTSKNMGWSDATNAANIIYNQSGLATGASEQDAADKVGMSLKDFRSAKSLVDEFNNLYASDSQGNRNLDPERRAAIDKQLADFTTTDTSLQKTPDRIALEGRFKNLQDAELKQMEEEVNYWGSDAGKKILDTQRQNVATQNDLVSAQLDRQKKALNGEIGVSDVLSKQIQVQFNDFKEAQARNGNVIMGDTPDTAVAKGSAGQQALGIFQDNIKAAVQREREAIIQGEGSVTQNNLNLSSGLSAGALQFGGPGAFVTNSAAFNNTVPSNPNYAGLNSMALSSAQPYQYQNQLQFNYDQLRASRNTGSGRSGLMGSLAGAGIGGAMAAMAPATAGMSIPMGMMLGSQFGGAAGLMFN